MSLKSVFQLLNWRIICWLKNKAGQGKWKSKASLTLLYSLLLCARCQSVQVCSDSDSITERMMPWSQRWRGPPQLPTSTYGVSRRTGLCTYFIASALRTQHHLCGMFHSSPIHTLWPCFKSNRSCRRCQIEGSLPATILQQRKKSRAVPRCHLHFATTHLPSDT